MIKFNKTLSSPSTAALVTAGAVLSAVMMVAAPAFAAGSASKSEIQRTYEKERADCLSGKTGQSQATCLKEAGAARQEALRGNLRTASPRPIVRTAG